MRKKILKKRILLALCVGSMLVMPPAYAAPEVEYEVGGDNVTEDKLGKISIIRTGAGNLEVIGLLNEGKSNFTLSQSPLTITVGAASADGLASVQGIKNSGETSISGNAVISITATGGNITVTDVSANPNTSEEVRAVARADASALGISNFGSTNISGNTVITVTATGGNAISKDVSANSNTSAEAYARAIARAYASAIGINNSGETNISGNTVITVTATGGNAISKDVIATANTEAYARASADAYAYALGINNSGETNISGNAVITVTATGGNAASKGIIATANMQADAYASADALVDAVAGGINNLGKTNISGNAVITVAATGGNATLKDDIATVNAHQYVSANARGINNFGKTSETTINGDTTIAVSATGGKASAMKSQALADANAYGIKNISGIVDLGKNTTITATAMASTGKAFAYSLYTEGGTININQAAGNPYTVKLTGDMVAARYNGKDGVETGTINLNLNNANSFLRGNVITKDGGTVNLTLANNAVWQPVYDNRNGTFDEHGSLGYSDKNNTIQALNLSGGVVDLSWDNRARKNYRNLNIEDLQGTGGTFRINTDLTNNAGDTIEIGTLNPGANMNIAVLYDPSLASVTQPTTIYAASAGYSPVKVGGAEQPVSGVMSDYRAYAITPKFTGTNLTSLTVGVGTNTKMAVGAALAQGQVLSQNHLKKRLGELRDNSDAPSGTWARMYKGTVSNDKYTKVESDYTGIQLGYDRSSAVNNGRVYNGVAVSYTDSDNSFTRGSGNDQAYNLALYHTWLGDSGHYYDLIAKGGRINTDYQVTDLSNNHSTADYKTSTYGLSAEYGYCKQLSNGWFLEPQAELSYGHINAASYVTSSGMNVRQDGINRLIGRAGIGVGRKLANGNQLYSTLSVLREFSGDTSVKADTLNYSQSMHDTWYEFIVGATGKLGQNSTGYINVEKLFGGYISSNWQVNAGCRWSF